MEPGGFIIYICEEETAARWSVVAGKVGEFGVEALKAEVEVEGGGVFGQ
jgi:hypothetical protein